MAESYLEKALVKLARQLNAYDEASLMSLWEKYAEQVRHFEPTKRWEESVIVFNMIQSMRFKNQLFNYNWSQSREPDADIPIDFAGLTAPEMKKESDTNSAAGGPRAVKADEAVSKKRKGKVLQLTPKE